MKTIQRAAFKKHLANRIEKTGSTGLQLICNERSCQWMTDGDNGATWLDEIHNTPNEAMELMRSILGSQPGDAHSARLIF